MGNRWSNMECVEYPDWKGSFREPGIGRIMVDIYGVSYANVAVCVLPVFLQIDNFQDSLLSFVQLFNQQHSGTRAKHQLSRILRVRPHSNYFPPPLHEMLIYNELDRLIEDYKLEVKYTSINVWNLKYEV